LALDPRIGNHDTLGIALAFGASLGLGIVVAVSGRVLRAGDSRRVTLHMAGVSAVLLIVLCAMQGDFALPETATGWLGFLGAATLYAFAMIAFFIAVSIIGPMRTSLLCYAEPVVSAGLGVILLGEVLTLVQVAGIALVVGALVGATLWQQRAK
jgi:probable blue pigment (indigoidine) exporter